MCFQGDFTENYVSHFEFADVFAGVLQRFLVALSIVRYLSKYRRMVARRDFSSGKCGEWSFIKCLWENELWGIFEGKIFLLR